MKNFSPYFKKEMLENFRTYRLLIIVVAYILFGLMEPIMYRMLPMILESEGFDPAMMGMMDTSQQGLLRSYMGNLSQIGLIIVTLTVMGTLAQELQRKYWILPRSKGGSAATMVLSKFFLYSSGLVAATLVGFMVNNFYGRVLFEYTGLELPGVIQSGLLFALYFIFLLSLLFLLISIIQKGIPAALLTLFVSFLVFPLLNNFSALQNILPYGLIQESAKFFFDWSSLLPVLGSTVFLTALCLLGTIRRIKTMEIL
jgi:ABC-2 type transport system permease protein